MSILKLAAVFVAGLLAGVGLCCTYILSLRATLKVYRFYIRERIDGRWKQATKIGSTLRHNDVA